MRNLIAHLALVLMGVLLAGLVTEVTLRLTDAVPEVESPSPAPTRAMRISVGAASPTYACISAAPSSTRWWSMMRRAGASRSRRGRLCPPHASWF